MWCKPSQCVWRGPSFLNQKRILCATYCAQQNAEKLIVTFLNIPDATYVDILEELASRVTLRSPSVNPLKQMLEAYKMLAHMASSKSAAAEIWLVPGSSPYTTRLTNFSVDFELKGLIYARGQWLRPSECVWNCPVEVSGRVPLEQSFPELREFFVEVLKVATMNTTLLTEELISYSRNPNKDPQRIKQIILAIGQMLAADPSSQIKQESLHSLRKSRFLPVRNGNEILFETPKADFCINDHERYGKFFQSRIKMLDFSYEDLTSLHPLFQCLLITNRYISGLVDTETTVNHFEESEYLTHHFHQRAYAFSWYV
jgi:hypothetical protein